MRLHTTLLDARVRLATDPGSSSTLAGLDVACTGRVGGALVAGFGVGGPIQIALTTTAGLSSAYAVLTAEPR